MAAISRPTYDAAMSRALARSRARAAKPVPAAPLAVPRRTPRRAAPDSAPTAGAAAGAADHSKGLVPYTPESKPRTVYALVDICCCFISSVWQPRTYRLPLKAFVHEVLRRSRVQYPVFQVALCYIMQLKPVIERLAAQNSLPAPLSCGRRVFVAALQVASKYLQDRSYSVASWAKISGLDVADLRANELALLGALNWETHIPYEAYLRCCKRLRITIDNAQVRADTQNVRQRAEQERRESQVSAYATPTASPDLPAIPVADAAALTTPTMAPSDSPGVTVWSNLA